MTAATAHYKPYPAYKPSGVEWLEDVPEHWRVKPLKHTAKMNALVLPETTAPDTEISYIDISSVDSCGNVSAVQQLSFCDAPSRARRVLRSGDTVVSTVRTYLKAVANFPKTGGNTIASTGFAVLSPPRGMDPRFLFRLVQSSVFIEHVVSHSEGVAYPAINPSVLGGIPAWFPPLPEQRAIANFLDRETGRIDALIEKKRRLIELLEEKRTALISHAVTKGLNPNAPMKPSGIEWLGDVPAHWEAVKLGYLCKMLSGGTPSKSNAEYWSGDIPWVSPKDMKCPRIWDAQDHISESALSTVPLVRPPVVLIVVRGMILAHSFPVGVTEVPVSFNQDMKALVPSEKVTCDYLATLLQGLKRPILTMVEESAHGTKCLRTDVFSSLQIFIPPLAEQEAVFQRLRNAKERINSLIAKNQEIIDKLQERRTALISAAVTGKIDVRGKANGI